MSHENRRDKTLAKEYDKLRNNARYILRANYRRELLLKLENTWMDNPTLAEFDVLISELKEMCTPKDKIRAAFKAAKKDYEKAFPGETFPFRMPV